MHFAAQGRRPTAGEPSGRWRSGRLFLGFLTAVARLPGFIIHGAARSGEGSGPEARPNPRATPVKPKAHAVPGATVEDSSGREAQAATPGPAIPILGRHNQRTRIVHPLERKQIIYRLILPRSITFPINLMAALAHKCKYNRRLPGLS